MFKNLFFFTLLFVSSLSALSQNRVLTPEEAFNVVASKVGDVVSIKMELGEGIYLYDEQLKLSISKPAKISLDTDIIRPKPENYEGFIVHKNNFTLLVPLSVIKKYVNEANYTLSLAFQGCSKVGICYQPMEKSFDFLLEGAKVTPPTQASQELSEESTIANSIANSSAWLVLLSFFGFGLLLSLTPCVFPMIPILSSIIVSQSSSMTTKKAFWLSLVYVLAMAIAYTIAGVLAGLFGANLQASLQNPWVIVSFSLVFVALALSMFGFYKIQLPSFIQSALTKKSDQVQGQGFISVAVMGFLSALIVGPCVAAPLAGALVYISQSGDALLGGAALFFMSLGMGVPLIAIGMSAGKFMPRPGGWMENVNALFGVIMLGVAIWMLSRIVPMQVTMLLSTFLLLASAIYMGALEPLEKSTNGLRKLLKSFAILLFMYAIALFIGTLSNASNFLNPLEKFTQTSSAIVSEKNDFKIIKNKQELQMALQNSSKPVILDFYATWCVSCVELEKFTFSDVLVKEKMKDFLLLKVDVTKNTDEDKVLLKEFGLFGPPAILFFKDAKELKAKRIIGFKNAKEFLYHLGTI